MVILDKVTSTLKNDILSDTTKFCSHYHDEYKNGRNIIIMKSLKLLRHDTACMGLNHFESTDLKVKEYK